METEIKLKAHPNDLPAVMDALSAAAALEFPPKIKHLESRYFDTPDRHLAGQKVALRVRKTDEGYIQTLKTAADAGSTLFARGEWESPVETFSPCLDDQMQVLSPEVLANLGLLFTTDIERQKFIATYPRYRPNATRIEIAFDSGVIRSNGQEQSVSEVELELLDGKASDVLDLALRLAEQLPLQLETDSKSARGYRLADNEIPKGVRAEALNFIPEVSLEDGMRESLRACIRQWFDNQSGAFDGRDIEGVHQMRVALRRLRSALVFFGDFIGEPPLGGFKEDAKWAAGSLGPARDWDVFLAETLPPVTDGWVGHDGLRALEESAWQIRETGYETARVAMMSPRYTAFALRISSWIERAGWRSGLDKAQVKRMAAPMSDLAGQLLDRRYAKVLKLGRKFDRMSREDRHELRIVLKRLRYAGDFFRSLYPKDKVKPFRGPMTDMLEKLGHMNDLTVAEHLCAVLLERGGQNRERVESGVAALLSWHEAHGAVAESAMRETWRAFCVADPYWR
ncbi:MAG: CHAD domain-containing protein [Alphaproteobacteria bacterium]